MCIFAGRVVRGEAGLYRYRWYAYGSWIIFASLMAGLAFVNREHAYINQSSFCYLPVRPFWYRLALSWIPRYVILLTITGLYLAIYCYVKIQFKQLGNETRASCLESVTEDPRTVTSVQTVKESNYTSEPSSPSAGSNNLSGSTARGSSMRKDSKQSSTSGMPSWERYSFGTANPLPPSEVVAHTELTIPESGVIPVSEAARKASATSSMTNHSTKRVSLARALRDMRLNSLAPFPRSKPLNTTIPTADQIAPDTLPPNPESDPFVVTALRRRHHAIKRQLRHLFIYPLVYLAVWTVPFASHCLQYSDYFSRNPPFALQCASVSILALQCAVDCCLFAFREKPWRHIDTLATSSIRNNRDYNGTEKRKRERSGKFWSSLQFWKMDCPAFLESGVFKRSPAIPGAEKRGKSRASMAWERRIAHRRRDLEEARNRESWGELDRKRRESDDRRGGRGRHWWEQEGKIRKDSLLVGVNTLHFSPAESAVRSPTITEEDGGGGQDHQEDISPHHSQKVVNDHSQELLEARQGKKLLTKNTEQLKVQANGGLAINCGRY